MRRGKDFQSQALLPHPPAEPLRTGGGGCNSGKDGAMTLEGNTPSNSSPGQGPSHRVGESHSDLGSKKHFLSESAAHSPDGVVTGCALMKG